jgi:sortase A
MSNPESSEKTVPMGIVLIVVGVIILVTAVGVWAVLPKTTQTTTPLAVATLPAASDTTDSTIPLLPETPNEVTEEELPAHFVSAEDAAQSFVTGQPERLVIPALELDAPVEDVGLTAVRSSGETYYQWLVPAAFRAGWHNTSAPLGVAGNTVLNGHHNVYGEVFGQLVNLEAGDEIILYDKSQEYHYTVAEVQILPERGQPLAVRMNNAQWIAPTNDERLTLVTCWPEDDNSHRVIVVAYPQETPDS